MAEEAAPDSGAAAPSGPSKGPLILALVNTLAVLAALGALVYTQVLFKRPPITESQERAKLAAAKATPKAAPTPGTVTFEKVTVNIKATPPNPAPADTSQQIVGKLHYATIGFSIELRDSNDKATVETLKPVIMDKVLGLLGRKAFTELATVQGRYVLRSQILDAVNELLLKETQRREVLVTNVYFNEFLVQ